MGVDAISAVWVHAILCTDCQHGDNCVAPLICERAGGATCLSYAPLPGKPMSPDHIQALPDREPCDGCACRAGTQANSTPHTMAQFCAAVDRGEPFFCHGRGSGRLCAGWLRAAKAKVKAANT